jgi:hypothetical protein
MGSESDFHYESDNETIPFNIPSDQASTPILLESSEGLRRKKTAYIFENNLFIKVNLPTEPGKPQQMEIKCTRYI